MPTKNDTLTVLMLGDVFGKPGRRALAERLPDLKTETGAGFVVVNGENAAGGLGLTPEICEELLRLPIDVITSGNHIWKHKDLIQTLENEPRLLRPANYPEGAPGRGEAVIDSADGIPVGVINLQGLLFIAPLPCPFREADRSVERIKKRTPIILVDFHAEATSEKRALGMHLEGRVSAVVGTHTHVPTADAEVLPGGTGYQSDLGMCGPTDSVIGVNKTNAIRRFMTGRPSPFQVAKGRLRLQGAVMDIDPTTGRCLRIEQRCWNAD
ncbi:MAG: TIGR00282 family metallophosphoesterase [Deltaproteobacteria bacterium]|nr:TIGR00282 family metallophosphoesterase [Deltaproteobacteria bacterium]